MQDTANQNTQDARSPWGLVLERERGVTTLALIAVVTVSWVYLLAGAGMPEMSGMDPNMIMAPMPWSAGDALTVFLMWWIMMAAMMLPSAAPTILLYERVSRRIAGAGGTATLAFATGYLLVWGGFSFVAAILHWALDQSGLLTVAMATASAVAGGAVLFAAGIWQFTPVKRACLKHCQSPMQFLSHHWHTGALGPLRMGVEYGVYCVGCCWISMGLLFYGGIMNFAWIGGIAIYVLIEKSVPPEHWITNAVGWALIVAGGAIIIFAI